MPWRRIGEGLRQASDDFSVEGRGDSCERKVPACRRQSSVGSFDLTAGHDQGPKVEAIAGEMLDLDNLVLCHRRCNGVGADHTGEVQERRRRQNEADLFGKGRKRAAG